MDVISIYRNYSGFSIMKMFSNVAGNGKKSMPLDSFAMSNYVSDKTIIINGLMKIILHLHFKYHAMETDMFYRI